MPNGDVIGPETGHENEPGAPWTPAAVAPGPPDCAARRRASASAARRAASSRCRTRMNSSSSDFFGGGEFLELRDFGRDAAPLRFGGVGPAARAGRRARPVDTSRCCCFAAATPRARASAARGRGCLRATSRSAARRSRTVFWFAAIRYRMSSQRSTKSLNDVDGEQHVNVAEIAALVGVDQAVLEGVVVALQRRFAPRRSWTSFQARRRSLPCTCAPRCVERGADARDAARRLGELALRDRPRAPLENATARVSGPGACASRRFRLAWTESCRRSTRPRTARPSGERRSRSAARERAAARERDGSGVALTRAGSGRPRATMPTMPTAAPDAEQFERERCPRRWRRRAAARTATPPRVSAAAASGRRRAARARAPSRARRRAGPRR